MTLAAVSRITATRLTSSILNVELDKESGCPLALFLFVISVELLAIAIRADYTIKGVKINNMEILISQLADDTCCVLADEQSVTNLISLLGDFAEISGLKCNKDKTELRRLDCLIHDTEPHTPVSVESGNFSTLGIVLGDEDNLAIENYAGKIAQFKNTLWMWKMRSLSIIGKAVVLKSLAIPKLLYPMSVSGMPPNIAKEIQDLVFNFVWNGSTSKVKNEVMYKMMCEGGLKVPNISIQSQALLLKWVQRIFNDNPAKCKETFQAFFLTSIFTIFCILVVHSTSSQWFSPPSTNNCFQPGIILGRTLHRHLNQTC